MTYEYEILLDNANHVLTDGVGSKYGTRVIVELTHPLGDWLDPDMVFSYWKKPDGMPHSLQSDTVFIHGDKIVSVRLKEE